MEGELEKEGTVKEYLIVQNKACRMKLRDYITEQNSAK